MKYCCDAFKRTHVNALPTERGTYIRFEQDGDHWYCWLISRSIDEKDLEGFSTTFPITLEAKTPLKFCPWCGKKLEKVYKKQWKNSYE